MKRRSLKTLFSVLMMFCLLLNCMSVMAADEHLGEIVDGSLLTDDQEAETTVYPRQRGAYITSGTCRILSDGNHKITVSGSTTCYVVCDEVKVSLVVDRLEGGRWVSYKIIGTKTAFNNYTVFKTKQLTVPGGYYYRVVSDHVAIEGDTVETLGGFSNGIWIN